MQIVQGFRYKARPSAAQAALLSRTAGCCRTLYNAALEQRSLAWAQQRRSVNYNAQSAELRELKAAFPWMKEAPHHCLQASLRDLQDAFQRFFQGVAKHPTFKKKGQHDSLRFPDPSQITLLTTTGRRGRIKLPKLGTLSFVQHRLPEGELRSVTLSREADGWYISLQMRREIPDPEPVDNVPVGVDLGVANTVTLSEGRGRFSVGGARPGEEKRMRRLQQKLARQQKGSRGRQKTKQKIVRLHQRIRRRRTDHLHRLSFHLAQSHGRVIVEALDVKAMTASAKGSVGAPGRRVRQKAGLNRSILAQGWGELRRQTRYKCSWYGSEYQALEEYAYTSVDCRVCGCRDSANRRSQAEFLCVGCGNAAHADENAADNILARGLRVTAGGALALVGGR